jgi:hypothetical protein
MESFLDTVAHMATVSYVAYLLILLATSFFGLQLILLATPQGR